MYVKRKLLGIIKTQNNKDKKRANIVLSINSIILGITSIGLIGINLLGVELPDVVTVIIGIIAVILISLLIYTIVKK